MGLKIMADLLAVAAQAERCQTFLKAIEQAGLTEIFKHSEPLTLLIPTDAAFAQLPAETVDRWLEQGTILKRILLYHVLFGDVRAEDLAQIDEAPTMEGSIVAVEHQDHLKINDAQVIKPDILADNGVIHEIDRVLMPAILSGEC